MFQIMPESEGNIIGLRASGRLTDQDYQEVLIPSLEGLIKEHGKIRLLCFMDEEFAGVEAAAMWDDAKYFLPHRNAFEKMAIVGGPQWIAFITKLFVILMRVKGAVKSFPSDQLPQAWEWVRS